MSQELNPPLRLCKAPMLAALEAHHHWLANLKHLRQMQLRADEGLLEADGALGDELANAANLNAIFNSQLAFINRQLAIQNQIWQGWLQIGASGPAVWAEQYHCAEKAWQNVFSDSVDVAPKSGVSAWEAWGDFTRSAIDAMNTMSGGATQTMVDRLASLQATFDGSASEKPAKRVRANRE
ncbi:hypothetical protein PAN31117_01771 [Pandoraea anapnoica]|uniref:Phasin domain-containing protein n=1 Tax=Pandoraea anapnoica TaxID=2508301 RepID=A0A5E4ZXW5_9BURK|nr:hypothetical protein [Pandoraea anapnoica]VVE65143.1 hypothetical protein PAN31117_01771 [Pandoraea anapnoica]